jgi:hypothetical protein
MRGEISLRVQYDPGCNTIRDATLFQTLWCYGQYKLLFMGTHEYGIPSRPRNVATRVKASWKFEKMMTLAGRSLSSCSSMIPLTSSVSTFTLLKIPTSRYLSRISSFNSFHSSLDIRCSPEPRRSRLTSSGSPTVRRSGDCNNISHQSRAMKRYVKMITVLFSARCNKESTKVHYKDSEALHCYASSDLPMLPWAFVGHQLSTTAPS